MWFAIDFSSHEPVYRQIMEGIKKLIATGKLKEGEYLPSIRVLARDLGVNVNTVARAYRELSVEGIIKPVRGEGYVVEKAVNILDGKMQELEDLLKEVKELGGTFDDVIQVVRRVFHE